jgi:hypothetical protein
MVGLFAYLIVGYLLKIGLALRGLKGSADLINIANLLCPSRTDLILSVVEKTVLDWLLLGDGTAFTLSTALE